MPDARTEDAMMPMDGGAPLDDGGAPMDASTMCDCEELDAPSGPDIASPALSFDLRDSPCSCQRVGDEVGKDARFTGAFTLAAEIRLDDRPTNRAPILSRWLRSGGERSYELGLDRTQYPYLLVSEDGTWGGSVSRGVNGDRQVRLTETFVVLVVFAPGDAIRLYINGHLVREVTSGVPGAVFEGTAPLMVGGRPSARRISPFDGMIGRVLLYDRALRKEELDTVACELGHTEEPPAFPPVRAITEGPDYHWFGYYDKHQFSPSQRYVLGNEVGFEGRAPQPDDELELGMVDLENDDQWITLGHTTAWNWQQGCMLQWRPGSDSEVVWNDREGTGDAAHYVTRVLNVDTDEMRTLPRPIYTIGPDGKVALGTDFRRLNDMRPGYGYTGIPDPNASELAPDDAGIYRMNMDTGETELIISYADAAAIPHPRYDLDTAKHYFNVLQINETGSRILFAHRWRPDGGRGSFRTRVFTANIDGTDLRLLSDKRKLSHRTWKDDRHILMWTGEVRGYSLYEDGKGFSHRILKYRNGHQSYLPGKEWMVSDTYPDGRGLQRPFLYNFDTDEIVALGHFRSPRAYRGRYRCDTHPRVSRDGKKIVIDSPHDGGRQMYLIDVARVLRNRTTL